MQETPVMSEISRTIKIANKTRRRPPMACIRVFLAVSSFFGSPPEFMNLYPLAIINARHTIPTKMKRDLTIFERTAGIQSRVATPPPTTQFPQSITKDYQR